MSCSPQRLRAIHCTAIANYCNDPPIRLSQLDADSSRNAPADTAADHAEIAITIAQRHKIEQRLGGGKTLINDNTILCELAAQRHHKPLWLYRLGVSIFSRPLYACCPTCRPVR